MLTLHDDPAATAAELARFDPADGRAFAGFSAEMHGVGGLLGPWFDRPPPGAPGWLGARDATRARRRDSGPRAATASRPRGCSRPRPASTSRALSLRAGLRGARLGLDLQHARRARRRPGTAYALLHEHAASRLRRPDLGVRPRAGWARSRGCSPRPPRGRRRDPHRRGGEGDRDRGRAHNRGPLANGDAIAAPTVLSNADPKRTLLGLVDEARSPPEVRAALARLQVRGREHEDQPRGRRAAADRGHPGRDAEPPPRAWSSSPRRWRRWTPTRRAPATGVAAEDAARRDVRAERARPDSLAPEGST